MLDGRRLTSAVGAAEDDDGSGLGGEVPLQAPDDDGEVGQRLRGREVAQRLGRPVRVVPERLRLPVEPVLFVGGRQAMEERNGFVSGGRGKTSCDLSFSATLVPSVLLVCLFLIVNRVFFFSVLSFCSMVLLSFCSMVLKDQN